jgi:hypothetical protein
MRDNSDLLTCVLDKIDNFYPKLIDVDEGWHQIVIDCDKELTAIDPNYKIFQVKQKFGGLRYYMTPSNNTTSEQRDKMHEVIAKYEKVASCTCEATGKPGILMKSPTGYYRTLNQDYALNSFLYRKYIKV